MTSSMEIQFVGPSWGHHGPYTFFRSFSYRPSSISSQGVVRSFSVGEFFFVRILSRFPICVAELQLLWESRRSVGTKLASVKLYFTPDSTPAGRLPHHGQDELLVADEKVVLEVDDLVKWVVEGPVTWPHGFRMPWQPHHQPKQQDQEEGEDRDASMATEMGGGDASSHPTRNGGCKEEDDASNHRHGDTSVVIVTYAQYCRCRALAKRLERGASAWMQNVVVMAMSGLVVAGDDARMMFCRETFAQPELMYHDFRRDRLAPKLKGRKRRRKLSRLDSMESVDSDAGQVATTMEDGEQLQRTKATVKRFKGLAMPSSSLELISSGKDAFEQYLYKFMRERKTPIKRIPSLGFKEVDLFQFFIYSQKFGGYDKVTEGRHWKQIYDQMGGHPGNTSAATCTRRIYEKLLLTFERHVRCEEDKPLPMTYMRPARKKLRELATMHDRHMTLLVSHDRPNTTKSVPAPILDDPCVAMVTGDNRLLETETASPMNVARSSVGLEGVVAVSVKVEGSSGQSVLTDGQPKIPLALTPPPQPKLKLKRGNSPPAAIEFQDESSKDQTVSDGNSGDRPLSPPVVQESTPVAKLNASVLSFSSRVSAADPPSVSTLSIDPTPSSSIKGDSLLIKAHPPLPTQGFPLPFFPFVPTQLEKPRTIDSTTTTVVGVLVATTTAPSNPSNNAPSTATDQKPSSKDAPTLTPFGFLPPKILLGSPTLGSVRSALVRPTYGPPNVVAPLTPTSNGLLVPVFDARAPPSFPSPSFPSPSFPSLICRPISSTDPQKPSSIVRHVSLLERASPVKPDPSPGRSCATTPSGAWFNSPIKQFLDRTRALASESHSDDQPMDLSVRSTMKPSGNADSVACSRAEQDEPLNLSRKQECRVGGGSRVGLVLPRSPKGSSSVGGVSGGGLGGRVVLPKTDLIMPLILSVPSPINILAPQSTMAAPSSIGSIHGLGGVAPTQGVVASSALHGKKLLTNNGIVVSTPTVLSSSSPFPTSLVRAAIGPLFQFFPSHPLASNIAYAASSEAGRPLLLRFPMPVPPPTTTQAHPLPPSLLATKGNKTN